MDLSMFNSLFNYQRSTSSVIIASAFFGRQYVQGVCNGIVILCRTTPGTFSLYAFHGSFYDYFFGNKLPFNIF